MNMTVSDVVISCPGCRRQFALDPALSGRPVRCSVCNNAFLAITASLSLAGPPVDLADPIECYWAAFGEACERLMRDIADLLRMSGQAVTRESILGIVKSLPRDPDQINLSSWRYSDCSFAFGVAFQIQPKVGEARERLEDIGEHLLHDFPGMNERARDMLLAALLGILGGLAPGRERGKPDRRPPRLPGPLERWARTRGW